MERIKTRYFEMEIKTTGGIRRERIKQVKITKKEYSLTLKDIEIIEFITTLKLFLKGKFKNIKQIMYFEDEIKIKIGDIIFSMYDVELLNEIFHELRKIYEII